MKPKLDKDLWEHSRWPLAEHFFDGSFAVMRLIMQLSNEELQARYLKEEYQERKKGRKKYDPLGGVLVFYRGEMDRRLKNGLVSFPTSDELRARGGEESSQSQIKHLEARIRGAKEKLDKAKGADTGFWGRTDITLNDPSIANKTINQLEAEDPNRRKEAAFEHRIRGLEVEALTEEFKKAVKEGASAPDTSLSDSDPSAYEAFPFVMMTTLDEVKEFILTTFVNSKYSSGEIQANAIAWWYADIALKSFRTSVFTLGDPSNRAEFLQWAEARFGPKPKPRKSDAKNHTADGEHANSAHVTIEKAGKSDKQISSESDNVPVSSKYPSCFISYSSKDDHFAKQLLDDLCRAGVKCWRAPENMKIGEKIRSSLENAISRHDKILLVLSENSVNSRWVEKEVEAAFEKEGSEGSVLFPIRLDDAVFKAEAAWVRDIKRMRNIGDFTGWKDSARYGISLARLLSDLEAWQK
jgi:hypothetical protein